MPEPKWAKVANTAVKNFAIDYRESLEEVAEGLARREHSEFVLERHVREADRVLELSGKVRKRWYARHETELAFGGALLGACPSVPDFLSGFAPDDSPWKRAIVCATMLLMIGAGLFLIVHGWLRAFGVLSAATDSPPRPARPTAPPQ